MKKRVETPWLAFLVILIGFVIVDVLVSTQLQWEGAVGLVRSLDAAGDTPVGNGPADGATEGASTAAGSGARRPSDSVQASGIYLLVTLALGMYVFASWVLARAWVTLRARPERLAPSHVTAIGRTLASIDPGSPSDNAEALVEKPIRDHALLRAHLSATTPSPVLAILGRLGPRDLLGHEPLEQALAGGVHARWRAATSLADDVDALGQICAVAGLASTVAGLIVAGTRLTSEEHVGLALSGALLKCFVGMFARLGCLGASHAVQQDARAEEEAVLAARGSST